MRDIVFAVIMLSLPAAVAVILGKTFLAVQGWEGEAAALTLGPERGAAIYARDCAACHGEAAGGTGQGPGLTGRTYRRDAMSDAAMRTAIRHGIAEPAGRYPPMPGFSGLEDAEIRAVIRFLRARQAG